MKEEFADNLTEFLESSDEEDTDTIVVSDDESSDDESSDEEDADTIVICDEEDDKGCKCGVFLHFLMLILLNGEQ